jgi:hypothetical protein
MWAVLPQLKRLKMVVLWGCYFTWGTERDLARNISATYGIRYKINLLVGSEAKVTSTVEPLDQNK